MKTNEKVLEVIKSLGFNVIALAEIKLHPDNPTTGDMSLDYHVNRLIKLGKLIKVERGIYALDKVGKKSDIDDAKLRSEVKLIKSNYKFLSEVRELWDRKLGGLKSNENIIKLWEFENYEGASKFAESVGNVSNFEDTGSDWYNVWWWKKTNENNLNDLKRLKKRAKRVNLEL